MEVATDRKYLPDPDIWDDEVRMKALFAPFRSESVNPAGFQDKMYFWIDAISRYCQHTGTAVVTHSTICQAFKRNGQLPQCIQMVLEHMLRKGELMPLADYEKQYQNQNWFSWGYNVLVQKPLSWGFSAVQNVFSRETEEEKYVHVASVRDLSDELRQKGRNILFGHLFVVPLDEFKEMCKSMCDDDSMRLALMMLQHEKRMLVESVYGEQMLKFKRSSKDELKPLTDVEKSILRLESVSSKILNEINSVEEDIIRCIESIRKLMKDGQKTQALIALKRKKRLEGVLKKKIAVQDNIEILLSQLRNKNTEKMVLDAYASGATTMKEMDVSFDNLDTVMADFEEVIENANEVQDAISKGVSLDTDLDELELELEELLAQEKDNKLLNGGNIHIKKPEHQPATEQASSRNVPEQTDQDIMRRLAALRAPVNDEPWNVEKQRFRSSTYFAP